QIIQFPGGVKYLRKSPSASTILGLSSLFLVRHVRQANVACQPALGQEPTLPRAWRNMSLRHVSLREMGWSRNPTSFGFARRSRNHRARRRTEFPKHALLASPQRVLNREDRKSTRLNSSHQIISYA